MAILNEKNERTQRIIHLLVTNLCQRNCKFCCNKQYDMSKVEYVTDEELKNAEILCLTGGEPFQFTNPCEIARYYKRTYPNIKKVYVYTNALELGMFLQNNEIHSIDGVNVSIKVKADAMVFDNIIKNDETIVNLSSNLLYVFDNLYSETPKGFNVFQREWQEDFEPADDSIFRRC